jgi:apolipoprotein N-acyltransferase
MERKIHNTEQNCKALSPFVKWSLLIGSCLLVAFGQPAWAGWTGILAASIGYMGLFRVLLTEFKGAKRFWMGTIWFACIQVIQLSWMVSHPYSYIYGVILFCAGMMGLQFGFIAWCIRLSLFESVWKLLAVAACWTVLEWSRLFFLSGFSWNPIGLALTSSLYSLQLASVGGIYLLSFWVMLTNLLGLRAWLNGWNRKSLSCWGLILLFPYLFGAVHFHWHSQRMEQQRSTLSVLLVQTAFPIEESLPFTSAEEMRQFVWEEWNKIFRLVSKFIGQSIDMVVLPEYVVPYGTYYPVFHFNQVKDGLTHLIGMPHLNALPPLEEPYAAQIETNKGLKWLVSNAFFVQTLANLFQADVVVGLEDVEYTTPPHYASYSSAFHFIPNNGVASRYEKRVLVPMGEYIPFEWAKKWAAHYGIGGSFTPGQEAKVFAGKVPFGASICYEETYGHLMSENRSKGAELLVNLTSDVWYPDSRLPQQHFDHARLRSVENGIPLVRSCNTGITGAFDSLGRVVKILGDDSFKDQWLADALLVEVPRYHYATLYAQFGDYLILLLCGIFIVGGIISHFLISKGTS